MIKYGLNFNASDIKDSLALMERQQNGVKTWQQLLGGASLGYENQVGALSSDFTDTIAEAYRANLLQRENIYRSGLGARETSSALHTNDANLNQAYMTYLSKYREGLSSAASAYGAETKAIQDAASERSKNLADLYASAYDYWANELFGSTRQDFALDENGNKIPIYEGEGKKAKLTDKYEMQSINVADEYGLTDLLNEEGVVRAWDDISHKLLNADGTLTDRGRQFFDQMFNLKLSGYTRTDDKGNATATRGFSQWLSDTNADLYDWAMSPDLYNANVQGTNFGTAKSLVGLKSTDDTYNAFDYTDWDKLDNEVKDFGATVERVDTESGEKIEAGVGKTLVDEFKLADYAANAQRYILDLVGSLNPTDLPKGYVTLTRDMLEALDEGTKMAIGRAGGFNVDDVLLKGADGIEIAPSSIYRQLYRLSGNGTMTRAKTQAMTTYLDSANARRTELDTLAKKSLGTAKYNSFVDELGSFRNTGKDIISALAKAKTAADIEKLVGEFDTWQKNYIEKLQDYGKAHAR